MPALPRLRRFLLLVGLAPLFVLGVAPEVRAQPTYKLDVKPNLKPLATLELKAGKFVRSEVKDDPGFRLQYHFKKDGKTVSQVEARSSDALDVPVTFFYDGDNKAREVESLLFLDSAFSLRLLRAYSKIKDQTVQRQLVSLMESIAANED